jgi:hypothetical protein
MRIKQLLPKMLIGGLILTTFAGGTQAKVYIATFTGTVGRTYDGGNDVHGGFGDVIDNFNRFGGGDLTGAAYTAEFSADFNPGTIVTDTGKALAVDGSAPITGKLTINGHSAAFTSSFQGLFGLASEDPTYGNGVSLQVIQAPFIGLDNEIENFNPFSPILDASLTTPTTYMVTSGDIIYGLFSVPNGGQGFGLMTAFLIPSTVAVRAVPEPACWALMVGGFGMVGGAMRGRRSITALARKNSSMWKSPSNSRPGM